MDGDVTWSRTPCEDGITLRAGDSWIRIRPRVHDVAGLRALVDAVLATLERPSAIAYEPPHELVTDEGELAIAGGARCVSRDRELECTVAIVAADPAMCIEALGEPGPAREHAMRLARELGLGLGAARRRWFRYDPPPGWFGLRRHGATVWLHPEHPRVPAIAHVFDARPFAGGDADRFDRFVQLAMRDDFVPGGDSTVTAVCSAHGLEGRLRVVEGTRRERALVRMALACADARFAYMAHFEGTRDSIDAVHRMLDSFRPLPQPPLLLDAFAMYG